jgi:hypothetical protein
MPFEPCIAIILYKYRNKNLKYSEYVCETAQSGHMIIMVILIDYPNRINYKVGCITIGPLTGTCGPAIPVQLI